MGMESSVEVARDGLAVHVHDEIAVIRHPQRRFGLLLGKESGPPRRSDGLFRRPDVKPFVLVQVPLRGFPHGLEGIREPHDGGVALDDRPAGTLSKRSKAGEGGLCFD